MSISAIVNAQDGEVRELVQHTPKRDKQSETKPGKVTLQPQPMPSLLGHSSASGLGFGTSSRSVNMSMDFGSPYATVGQTSQPPTQHTFERIQFQRATANNGKRRAQQQYYNLVVDLYAEIPSPLGSAVKKQWVKIARRISDPMVVRGRSPGHYKDGRRDSSTSMGPDGRTGGSGDGKGGGAVLPSGIGHGPRSNLPLMSYDHSRHSGSHYGRSDYRQMAPTDHPPLSDSPLMSSSSSSAFEFPFLNDPMEPIEPMPSCSYPEQTFSSSSEDRRSEGQFTFPGPSAIINYDALSHNRDHTEASFGDSFDSVAAVLQDDRVDPRRLKRSHRDIHTTFDGPYSRLDARANSRRLCA
ncbi:NDT80 / PhoG like DNA-binding family protein [Paecilomyces variotii No. 5]|uniref:NDT80 / PhoG like DNA-binding family protein n=1 Tax=Byssochlamys spectabilis (strain No. 5 / NBRC 109023) TaxID=1356009 RepID=V5I0H3_BYSSN|nr:NDT80 / PhoG like DNA-binding family protein [Paecilomyces variotii No. 5]